jgi:hypothetical protein
MKLGNWVRVAMKRHLALVVDYQVVAGQDAAFDGSIRAALDSIAETGVHVVMLAPSSVASTTGSEHDVDSSWWYVDDGVEVTMDALRDHIDADTIVVLADPTRHPALFATADHRDVAIAVRGHADSRGWLSGSLSVREFVRWLIAIRTGWTVRAPRFDAGWA